MTDDIGDGPEASLSSKTDTDIEKTAGQTTINREAEVTPNASNIVDWDGPDDVQNPLNWSSKTRWTIIVFISAVTFNQAMSSTIFAPGIAQVTSHFHNTNSAVASLLVSIYVIGLAVGPMVLSPLSELYGRVPLMHATNISFLVGAIVCATATNIPVLLVFRLVMGASTISLGGGYVADLMKPERRGRAMNVWTVGPVLAPVIGPIAGGYISMAASWRWTFGLVGIGGAVATIACIFLPETYGPRLLELKSRRLRKETGNEKLRSKHDTSQSPRQRLAVSIIRPCKMLLRSPIVGLLSLFLAIAYSYMYLMFTTFPDVFSRTYGFNTGESGLAYLGLGIGSLIGQYAIDIYATQQIKRHRAMNKKRKPEDQLPPLLAAGILLPAGLCWYGWSAEYRVHWIVPILGTAVCGAGIMCCFYAVQTYLVEAYMVYAASALAASSLVRCAFGATIPLAGPPLYQRLGLGWGNTLLGLCALTIAPASVWLMRCGQGMREMGSSIMDD